MRHEHGDGCRGQHAPGDAPKDHFPYPAMPVTATWHDIAARLHGRGGKRPSISFLKDAAFACILPEP